jgi:hypothetical protein
MCRLISPTIYLIYRPNAARSVSFSGFFFSVSLVLCKGKNNSLEFIQTRQFLPFACHAKAIKSKQIATGVCCCCYFLLQLRWTFSRLVSTLFFLCCFIVAATPAESLTTEL